MNTVFCQESQYNYPQCKYCKRNICKAYMLPAKLDLLPSFDRNEALKAGYGECPHYQPKK